MGFRFSYLASFVEAAMFVAFIVLVISIESAPIPTILLCATIFYLACVFIDIWFIQQLPPHSSFVEWLLSIGITICALVFGFIQGMAIGITFTSIIIYSTKRFCCIVDENSEDVENLSKTIQLKGHMSHGNTTKVFDIILNSEEDLKSIYIDLSKVNSADSSLSLFLHGLAILSSAESVSMNIRHCYELSSHEYSLLKSAGALSKQFHFESNHEY